MRKVITAVITAKGKKFNATDVRLSYIYILGKHSGMVTVISPIYDEVDLNYTIDQTLHPTNSLKL